MRALLLALGLCPLFAQGPQAVPRGEVVSRVICASQPQFSYALYLPSGYREDRSWPVLFGFSPGGVGEEPVRLFQRAAERFGWILVGSNDSKNGPLRPALAASDALWKDVQARFKVDVRRNYAAGFSGGARMAMRLALRHPRNFAGLISIGAFGTGDGLLTGLGHLRFYLCAGQEDFNHWELLEGRQELESRGWKALADRFEGGHRWAPEASATAALTFMELGAMEQGWIPKDSLLEPTFRQTLEIEAEKTPTSLLAMRRWKDLAALFPNTPEGKRANDHAALCAKDPSVIGELKLEQEYREVARELAASRGDSYSKALNRHLTRLREAHPAEQRLIRCTLGIAVASCQQALAEALQRKSWEELLVCSTNLAALDEREGWPCIYAAAALTQLGRLEEAIPHLQAAQRRGYRKPQKIRDLEELRPLHNHQAFEAILRQMEPARPQ